MKTAFVLASLLGVSMSFPTLAELKAELAKRQFSGSTELLGDLITLPDIALSTTAKDVKAILLGTGAPTDLQSSYTTAPPALGSSACTADRCCVWKHIADSMLGLMFDAANGVCTDFARGAIRMGFHDAATWNKTMVAGGADGSILLASDVEMARPENEALIPTAATMMQLWNQYRGFGITMADLIQTAAKVGAVACPGGPRIRMFIGRVDDPHANPTGLLPPPFFNATQIIDMFAAKTVTPGGVVALIGSHTASRQRTFDRTQAGAPQDTTPGKWDTSYFTETLATNASPGVVRFPSDISLANSPVTGPVFQQFASQKSAWDKVFRHSPGYLPSCAVLNFDRHTLPNISE
jgi:manganese peroxidase